MATFWLITAFAMPILVAVQDGSTYTFAFSVSGVGVVLYFINVILIHSFISKYAPQTYSNDSWEDTAGTGIVPKWVSAIGIFGIAFIPAGLIIAVLIAVDLVSNQV